MGCQAPNSLNVFVLKHTNEFHYPDFRCKRKVAHINAKTLSLLNLVQNLTNVFLNVIRKGEWLKTSLEKTEA